MEPGQRIVEVPIINGMELLVAQHRYSFFNFELAALSSRSEKPLT